MNTNEIKGKIKKYKLIIIGMIMILIVLGLRITGFFSEGRRETLSSSTLIKTVDITELSTAQFTYNGIAEVPKYKGSSQSKCHILYKAIAKAKVNMKDIHFKINKEKKTVRPILPKIKLTATIVDEKSLSFIPSNSKIEMKEVLSQCEKDAQKEINNSSELYKTAKENLQDIVEALISPIINSEEYKIVWE